MGIELDVSPVEEYEAPDIPTFEDNNPAMLKKLPSRWKKNAKIIACVGIIGALTLLKGGGMIGWRRAYNANHHIIHNLGYTHGSHRGFSRDRLLVRLHSGGMGSSIYMVHLTEQEAFGILRARLEAAGLNFDAAPPWLGFDQEQIVSSYGFLSWLFRDNNAGSTIDLFDTEKGVGITYISRHNFGRFATMDELELAIWVERMHAERANDIEVGIFFSIGQLVGGSAPIMIPLPWEIIRSRPILVRQLINQADKFIARLQSEGILERFPDVKVTINDVPLSLGEYPILINNMKMVPALELFEALGMDAVEDIHPNHQTITATKKDIRIWVSSGGSINITNGGRNRNWAWLQDIPVIFHNDTILAPVQYIANLTGATIEWNEDERIIKISTRG